MRPHVSQQRSINGRATSIQFAREGASVLVADRDLASAKETAAMIVGEGGTAAAVTVDVTVESSVVALIERCCDTWGRIDVLHNNVGMSLAGGDAPIDEITTEAFDRLVSLNLRGMVLTAKHALPHMREAAGGVILNVSSMAAWLPYPYVAYKTTKAAVIALTEQLAQGNAKFGIRANVILPGLINTPMAVEARITAQKPRAAVIAERDGCRFFRGSGSGVRERNGSHDRRRGRYRCRGDR